MKLCVAGLWHLGAVTAACTAEHFATVGYDPDGATIAHLRAGRPPIQEPGLAELIRTGLSAQRLSFSDDPAESVRGADILWLTFDTPVDERDRADSDWVARQAVALLPHLAAGSLVLVSSQVPVGFTARLESSFRSANPGRDVRFAYLPENLQLGRALDSFRRPERIVVGLRDPRERERLAALLAPFCRRIEWMSVESAEMTKHALNAFLATSVAFINELAALCEHVGADAGEVERGLKSEPRIGPKAYLRPGAAFAGGTLARDVAFLEEIGEQRRLPTHLLSAVLASNRAHQSWPQRKLQEVVGNLASKSVGVLGLAYKPGTDTLRRSSAVELCLSLAREGARVRAFDPGIRQLPPELDASFSLCGTASEVWQQADALVVATEWPEFREIPAADLSSQMRSPVVIDPGGFLRAAWGDDPRLCYISVGSPRRAG
jgi:UDPglucose 6-dehydrogenase